MGANRLFLLDRSGSITEVRPVSCAPFRIGLLCGTIYCEVAFKGYLPRFRGSPAPNRVGEWLGDMRPVGFFETIYVGGTGPGFATLCQWPISLPAWVNFDFLESYFGRLGATPSLGLCAVLWPLRSLFGNCLASMSALF